jgi:hypothetical protein
LCSPLFVVLCCHVLEYVCKYAKDAIGNYSTMVSVLPLFNLETSTVLSSILASTTVQRQRHEVQNGPLVVTEASPTFQIYTQQLSKGCPLFTIVKQEPMGFNVCPGQQSQLCPVAPPPTHVSLIPLLHRKSLPGSSASHWVVHVATGLSLGLSVGKRVGSLVGLFVGKRVGALVGLFVGK